MKRVPRWLASAAACALLAGGSAARADGAAAGAAEAPAAIATETCPAVLDGLRRTEAATRDAITAVREQRRHAEELRDWFGHEMFGPYVSALRGQERVLQEGLAEIRTSGCGTGNHRSD